MRRLIVYSIIAFALAACKPKDVTPGIYSVGETGCVLYRQTDQSLKVYWKSGQGGTILRPTEKADTYQEILPGSAREAGVFVFYNSNDAGAYIRADGKRFVVRRQKPAEDGKTVFCLSTSRAPLNSLYNTIRQAVGGEECSSEIFENYRNSENGFGFSYPTEFQITKSTAESISFEMPIPPQTNLIESTVEVSASTRADYDRIQEERSRRDPNLKPLPVPTIVVINGQEFKKEEDSDVAAGNWYSTTTYTVCNEQSCVCFTQRFHGNPEAMRPDLRRFDGKRENDWMQRILFSFYWEGPLLPRGIRTGNKLSPATR